MTYNMKRYTARVRHGEKVLTFICNARNRKDADEMLRQHLSYNPDEPKRYKWKLSKGTPIEFD